MLRKFSKLFTFIHGPGNWNPVTKTVVYLNSKSDKNHYCVFTSAEHFPVMAAEHCPVIAAEYCLVMATRHCAVMAD